MQVQGLSQVPGKVLWRHRLDGPLYPVSWSVTFILKKKLHGQVQWPSTKGGPSPLVLGRSKGCLKNKEKFCEGREHVKFILNSFYMCRFKGHPQKAERVHSTLASPRVDLNRQSFPGESKGQPRQADLTLASPRVDLNKQNLTLGLTRVDLNRQSVTLASPDEPLIRKGNIIRNVDT